MITLQQAQAMHVGQTLHHNTRKNTDGTPMRVRKNGTVKVWKRTGEWRMPVKYGMYDYGYIGTRDTYPTASDIADPAAWNLQA